MRIIDKFGRPLQPGLPAVNEKISKKQSSSWDYRLEKVAHNSRIIISEGISGSGKDTLQKYLKRILRSRDIHDYSEGEVLQSWNQLQIKGISRLQIKFMTLFLKYMKAILDRDERAVFLLNRFHLSAYVLTVAKEPKLKREYDEIIGFLKSLPVHVFILKLDANEIEARSLHPERSGAWHKFQEEILKRDGFRDGLERYLWQQQTILEVAETQELPYSVVKIATAPHVGLTWIRTASLEDNVLSRESAQLEAIGRNRGVAAGFRQKPARRPLDLSERKKDSA